MILKGILIENHGKLNHIKFLQNTSLVTRARDLKFKNAHTSLNCNSISALIWKCRSQVMVMEVLVCSVTQGTLIRGVPDDSLRNTGQRWRVVRNECRAGEMVWDACVAFWSPCLFLSQGLRKTKSFLDLSFLGLLALFLISEIYLQASSFTCPDGSKPWGKGEVQQTLTWPRQLFKFQFPVSGLIVLGMVPGFRYDSTSPWVCLPLKVLPDKAEESAT